MYDDWITGNVFCFKGTKYRRTGGISTCRRRYDVYQWSPDNGSGIKASKHSCILSNIKYAYNEFDVVFKEYIGK